MKVMYSKYVNSCADSGKLIMRGDKIYYDFRTKKAYHPDSDFVRIYEQRREREAVMSYIDEQEMLMYEKGYR